jgi:hypothetical protein
VVPASRKRPQAARSEPKANELHEVTSMVNTGGVARASALAGLVAAFLALGCGRNPVLGEWEIDTDDNTQGVLLAVEAAEMESLTFSGDAVTSPGTEIPVEYVVEEAVVRAVRGDGRGEHRVEVLSDGRIRVELPIGVTAVYRRPG